MRALPILRPPRISVPHIEIERKRSRVPTLRRVTAIG